jgi:putative peptidoglycan lipid II flippase
MAPALLGTGVTQLNVLADRFLAYCLGNTAVGALWFSQRLVYLPVGLFGVAMGIVCLPAMSRAWSRGAHEAMHASMTYVFRQVLFLALPCAVLLGVAASPTIRLLFERGAFDNHSTAETVWALAFYLPGIPAFCCAKVAVTPFYACHDTRTPVRIALLCMLVNLALNLILMQFLRQGGLALATTISSWLNVALLLRLIHRRGHSPDFRELGRAAARIGLAALLAAAAAHAALHLDPAPTAWPDSLRLFVRLTLCGTAGGVVYVILCLLFGSREPRELATALRKRH